MTARVHPSAEVEDGARLGADVAIWNWTKVRAGAVVGDGTSIGQCSFVDAGVTIGARCKIQNGVQVYRGVTLGDAVFIGPNATFTNDLHPRADPDDWQITPTVVEDGATIGAAATIVCGVRLGGRCMVAAGSVVTRDVAPFALVAGVPARQVGWVDERGFRTEQAP
jgi:UDP-2-acetamido-3-amino-2,3-dideoxy-glucuronate N-acetyltransferase